MKPVSEIGVAEIVGIETSGQFDTMYPDAGVLGQCVGDFPAGRSAGMVAIEHQDDPWRRVQELELSGGELDTEQCDGGEADLHQAHDAPGRFHHHESLAQLCSDVMKAVEDFAFRQAGWKLPFSVTARLLGIESPSGIAEGMRLRIVEADCDTPLQKSGTFISTRIEALRRFSTDPFLL